MDASSMTRDSNNTQTMDAVVTIEEIDELASVSRPNKSVW
jgi:hypothetical protein